MPNDFMKRLSEIAGQDAAGAIAAEFGGVEVYIPRRPFSKSSTGPAPRGSSEPCSTSRAVTESDQPVAAAQPNLLACLRKAVYRRLRQMRTQAARLVQIIFPTA